MEAFLLLYKVFVFKFFDIPEVLTKLKDPRPRLSSSVSPNQFTPKDVLSHRSFSRDNEHKSWCLTSVLHRRSNKLHYCITTRYESCSGSIKRPRCFVVTLDGNLKVSQPYKTTGTIIVG